MRNSVSLMTILSSLVANEMKSYDKVSVSQCQLSSDLALEIGGWDKNAGAEVILWSFGDNQDNQVWSLQPNGVITSGMNDLVLTESRFEANSYNKLLMQPKTHDSNQLWKIVGITIRLQDHPICINSHDGITAKGTKLDAYTCNGQAS